MSGISFFPHDNGRYAQAPYEEITEEVYNQLVADFPDQIDWHGMMAFEADDQTVSAQTLACAGGVCEI